MAFDLGMSLGTSQRLEQTLTPQLLQSVNILQKTSMEIETAIKDEVESNPLLELDDSVPEEEREVRDEELPDSGSELVNDAGSDYDPDNSFENGSLEDSAMMDRGMLDNPGEGELDYERYLSDGSSDEDAPYKDLNVASKDADEEWDRPIKDNGKSLQEQLRDQLMLWSGTRELQEQ
ncbi:MAG: RNA polymerase sigma-54 factor, partial [Fibrobacter sp.]|nr:RNA polymerase sigma-54 factor [Fibrobacter sp.]